MNMKVLFNSIFLKFKRLTIFVLLSSLFVSSHAYSQINDE